MTGMSLTAINSSQKFLKIVGPTLSRINSVIISARTEFDLKNKAFWYVSKPVWIHLRYVSMRGCVAFGSGSRGVPPPRLFQVSTRGIDRTCGWLDLLWLGLGVAHWVPKRGRMQKNANVCKRAQTQVRTPKRAHKAWQGCKRAQKSASAWKLQTTRFEITRFGNFQLSLSLSWIIRLHFSSLPRLALKSSFWNNCCCCEALDVPVSEGKR